MAYATTRDITDRYGPDALTIASDRDGDGQPDPDAVARSLGDASAEIDSYLQVRYELPLAVVPPVLVRLCVDIAIYRLSATADIATEEQRRRYDDAIRWLQEVARGLAGLVLPKPEAAAPAGAAFSGQPRVFSRQTLRGF